MKCKTKKQLKDTKYPNKMVQDALLETANACANNSKIHKTSNSKELEKLLNED